MSQNELDTWLDRIESFHPEEIEMGLQRVKKVAERLNCLTFNCPVVSVAGTNGKGSTVECLTQLTLAHDLSVGSYSSPHLFEFNERIRINGNNISAQALISAFEKVEHARQETPLSFFEFTTLTALVIFKELALDLIVLEVGLGGRLDAVNIVDSNLSIITSIGIDHEAWLGNTREQVASEKAGIARKACYCIVGEKNLPINLAEALNVIGAKARYSGEDFNSYLTADSSGKLTNLEINFKESFSHIENDLKDARSVTVDISTASIASQNISLAIAAYAYLGLPLKANNVNIAIGKTQLKGRFQVHSLSTSGQRDKGKVIFDLTHNPSGAEFFVTQLEGYIEANGFITAKGLIKANGFITTKGLSPFKGNITALFAVMSDKDIAGIVNPMLPFINDWLVCDIDSARAASAESVKAIIDTQSLNTKYKPTINISNSIESALVKYLKRAQENDILLVFGSFHTVGPAMQYLNI